MLWDFRRRFGKTGSLEAELAAGVEAYRNEKLLGVPSAAVDVMGRTNSPRFAVLGTKDFGSAFIDSVAGRYEIACVVDDFKSHKGLRFHGVPIISSDRFLSAAASDPTLIAVNSCRFDYSRRYFERLCEDNGIPLLNFEQGVRLLDLNAKVDHRLADWAPTISANADRYFDLAKRLSDSYSMDTLYSVLLFHLSCDPEWHQSISKPYSSLYFRSGLFALADDESLVDCGASIGESTTAFIDATKGRIRHSWMIEPDRFNLVTLEDFLRKHEGSQVDGRISLHPYAVGSEKSVLQFNHVGWHGGSIAVGGGGNGEVEVDTIEAIVDSAPSIIKMDIEGAEMDALRGAKTIISDYRPKLLVSAYHRSTDLLEITALIDSLRGDYQVGLRHHTEDRWDSCLYFY
jgi:FkbM family methyltransferase